MRIDILVGIDHGETLPEALARELGLIVVESPAKSQAAALNACIRNVKTDLLAFIEDDDRWHPRLFEIACRSLRSGGFVSSTQLEVDENEVVIRINDFPTPSGWLMPLATFRAVGEFNERFRWHLDNEWLGRLAESKIKRIHLVESTGPVGYPGISQIRPWLANVIEFGGEAIRLMRHEVPYPLVVRLVHSQSGAGQISRSRDLGNESRDEIALLRARFGRIPW